MNAAFLHKSCRNGSCIGEFFYWPFIGNPARARKRKKGRMSGPGYNLPFELGDAMAEETHQFCAGEFVFVATRAQLYHLKGQATIRNKFAGRPWTHSADPDCEMWGSCKDLTGSQTALSREPWLRFCHYRWLV